MLRFDDLRSAQNQYDNEVHLLLSSPGKLLLFAYFPLLPWKVISRIHLIFSFFFCDVAMSTESNILLIKQSPKGGSEKPAQHLKPIHQKTSRGANNLIEMRHVQSFAASRFLVKPRLSP